MEDGKVKISVYTSPYGHDVYTDIIRSRRKDQRVLPDYWAVGFSGCNQEPDPVQTLPIGVARLGVIVIGVEGCSLVGDLVSPAREQNDSQVGLCHAAAGNDSRR